ncbi:MAG: aminoglycoside phosphotransferase family protein [Nitrospirae bacterium]|jgi:thiamine kinase-like enzyme|nr:aminoglycoside phosphotransferase family protein [Nitrospirota bacterium]
MKKGFDFMNTTYLGRLEYSDPLYEILFSHVCDNTKYPIFRVDRMSSSNVYKYTEENTNISIVGKFFKLNDVKIDRVLRIKGEYDNLNKIRSYGFDVFPNYVVKPISKDERIGLALTEEFITGKNLDYYLKKAIFEGKSNQLKDKLERLADFLYVFHDRTRSDKIFKIEPINQYFQKITSKLLKQTVISDNQRKYLLRLMDKWLNKEQFSYTKNSLVHGDATPTNFIFSEAGYVIAIDLERMKDSDPAYDIGMVCGEIKHAFLWRTGNPYLSEPFIRHFLINYAKHFHDSKKAFKEITQRNPFYMAMTELRIARNNYLHWEYRKRLVYEAEQCLKWGLKLL